MQIAAHLCPRNIRCDKEFNVSVAENAQDRAPKVPVRQAIPPFEQFRGGVLLARLVFAPREAAVATRLLLLDVALRVSEALVRGETRKHKDGLDAQFFERPEVALDARRQAERESTGRGEERFARRWGVVQRLEVVGGIDSQAGVRKDVERKCLEVLPVLKESWEKIKSMLRARGIGHTLKVLDGHRRLLWGLGYLGGGGAPLAKHAYITTATASMRCLRRRSSRVSRGQK